MRVRFVILVSLMMTLFAAASPEKKAPDAMNIVGNTFESPYFKFHYSVPEAWVSLDDILRMERNRQRHKEAGKKSAGTIHWTYDLLLAAPTTVPLEDKLTLPYIRILAIEDVPGPLGTYTITLARAKSIKFLREPRLQNFSGHRFVESALLHNESHCEAVFETTQRNYLLIFEFHGRTQDEVDALARTMGSIRFEK
jgi:hypothetical protein